MKVDTKELDNAILYVLDDIISRHDIDEKTIIENIENSLYDKGIYEADRIINKSISIETVKIQKKYYLAKALYKETGMELIKPDIFFTEIDIKQLEKFEFRNKKDNNDENYIEFKNFIEVIKNEQWNGVMTIGEIAELYNIGIINYNIDTQRESTFKEFKDKTIEAPKTNTHNVNEIMNGITSGEYIPDEITFNIRKDGYDELDYKNSTLCVHKGSIDVIDGYHRSKAILQTLIKHPELADKRVMEIRIVNFTIEKAQKFIVQKNKQTKIAKRKIQSMSIEEYENQIVNDINKSVKSDLRGLVALDEHSVLSGKTVIGFEKLADAIKENFVIETGRDARKISEFLINFFNEIYGIFYDEFKNVNVSRRNNYKLHAFTFVGYVAIASKLYEDDEWITKLEDILNQIDFSKDNTDFKDILPQNGRIIGKYIKAISTYFKVDLIKGVE